MTKQSGTYEMAEGPENTIVVVFTPTNIPLDAPWDRIIINELATNPGPWPKPDGKKSALDHDGGWWTRTLDQIDALTFHHTYGSHSPHAMANYYIDKRSSDAIGRPSTPYAVWITETGEVLLCVSLEKGCWHDHTGHRNTHLSVGLAGSLHVNYPSDAQLNAAAKVATWAIKSSKLPTITSIDHITGHMDWTQTACPGWASASSGHWKSDLYARIEALLT